MKYVLMPFIAWGTSGTLKFIINYLRFGKEAKNLIGYGGFPSTHTTILSSVVFLAGFTEGFNTPIFSLGLALLILVIFDAHSLRRKVGKHAEYINQMRQQLKINDEELLRERMGHTWIEIFAGLILSLLLSYIVFII